MATIEKMRIRLKLIPLAALQIKISIAALCHSCPLTIFNGQQATHDPIILRLIGLVVRESGDTPVSLCGELAGRIDVITRLPRTGIRPLGVAAELVQDVKDVIMNSSC